MILWIGIILGVILGAFGWIGVSVSEFIGRVDDMENGSSSNALSLGKDDFIFINRWMLAGWIKWQKSFDIKSPAFLSRIMCFVLVLLTYILSFWSKDFMWVGILYGIVTFALFELAIVDWNTQYIPFEFSIIIFLCGLIQLFADVSNWEQYVIGLIAVSGFLYIVDIIATPILRKKYGDDDISHVIGDGDIKLMAATGLLLGWKLNFLALGLGCITGSVIHLLLMRIKKGERQFAFGPYLSLGVYITMICGEQLVSWYLNMMRV